METTALTEPQVRVDNGTATMTYLALLQESGVLRGSYSFPKAPGDVLVMDCLDYMRYLEDEPFRNQPVVARNVMSGSVNVDSYDMRRSLYRSPPPDRPDNTTGELPDEELVIETSELVAASPYCPATYVVFEWGTGNASWQDNAPSTALELRTYPLDTDAGGVLMFLAVVSAILTLTGGISWGSQRGLEGYAPATIPAAEAESTAETLYRLAENTGHWLERTRRYLLLSGVLGIFLWYPILVPWAYRAGRDGSFDGDAGLVLAAAVLLFLLVLTFIWGRTFLRLDRELADWRERMARLQRREQELLDSLERDG